MRGRFVCENASLRACTQIDNAYNVHCIGLLYHFCSYHSSVCRFLPSPNETNSSKGALALTPNFWRAKLIALDSTTEGISILVFLKTMHACMPEPPKYSASTYAISQPNDAALQNAYIFSGSSLLSSLVKGRISKPFFSEKAVVKGRISKPCSKAIIFP